MRSTAKPVRKCYSCRLNLGDHCWLHSNPRGQWRSGRRCAAFGDAAIHGLFEAWRKQPSVKSRKDLRRSFFRAGRRRLRRRGADERAARKA